MARKKKTGEIFNSNNNWYHIIYQFNKHKNILILNYIILVYIHILYIYIHIDTNVKKKKKIVGIRELGNATNLIYLKE